MNWKSGSCGMEWCGKTRWRLNALEYSVRGMGSVGVCAITIHQFILSFIHLVLLHLGNSLYAFVYEAHVLRLFAVCKTSVYGIREMEMSCVGWCQAFLVGVRRFPILLRITLLCFALLTNITLCFISSLRLLRLKSNFLLNFKLRRANWKQYSAIRSLVLTWHSTD